MLERFLELLKVTNKFKTIQPIKGVSCFDSTNQQYVDKSECYITEKPKPHWLERCYVTCAPIRGCVFTEWSDWSTCRKGCGGVKTRSRTLESMWWCGWGVVGCGVVWCGVVWCGVV